MKVTLAIIPWLTVHCTQVTCEYVGVLLQTGRVRADIRHLKLFDRKRTVDRPMHSNGPASAAQKCLWLNICILQQASGKVFSHNSSLGMERGYAYDQSHILSYD